MWQRRILWSVFVLIGIPAVAYCAKSLPSYIKPCRKSDPEFNGCLLKSMLMVQDRFAKGYKPLGVSQLEPFFVEKMELGDPPAGSAVSLKQVYHNVSVYGMIRTHLSDMDANFKDDNCYWRFSALTPLLRMEADYQITGQVLVFPLDGSGKCNNTLADLKARHSMRCERYVKENKTFLRVTNYTLELNPGKVTYQFDNLVKDNPQITEEIHKSINENALIVFGDVKYGFQESFNLIYKTVINRVFSRVPENELFLD